MKRATVVLAVLLMCRALYAAAPEHDFNRWRFYGILAGADLGTSEFAFARGGAREAGPLMQTRAGAYAVKAVTTLVAVKVDRWLARRLGYRAAHVFRGCLLAWYSYWIVRATELGIVGRR